MQNYPPQPQWQGQPQQPLQPYSQEPYFTRGMGAPPLPPPQKKKSRAWLWIVLGIVALLVFSCIGFAAIAASQPQTSITAPASVNTSTSATQIPATGKWTTTHTFSGSGEKTTATFSTSGDWKLTWTAQASNLSEAFFGVSVYDASGNLIDTGATSTIPAGKQGADSTEEHTGAGSFYLKVYAGVPWTITVQELK